MRIELIGDEEETIIADTVCDSETGSLSSSSGFGSLSISKGFETSNPYGAVDNGDFKLY